MKSIRLRDREVRAIQNGATQIRRLVKSRKGDVNAYDGVARIVARTGAISTSTIGFAFGPKSRGRVATELVVGSPFGDSGDMLIHKATGLELVTKAVRVERVQEISEAGAVAMGFDGSCSWASGAARCDASGNLVLNQFASQWASDNGPDSWGRNDYVWVGEIERKES